MDTLRRRVPFRSDADTDAVEEERVLDDQEQEEVIAELRSKAESLDRRIYLQARAYAAISCIIHVIFFFRPMLLDEPPILFFRLFVLIHILIHVNLLLHLTPAYDTPLHRFAKETPFLPLPILWTLGIACFAPLVSLVSGKSWQQVSWWSITFVISLLVWVMLQSVQESNVNLANIEELRYDAKGA